MRQGKGVFMKTRFSSMLTIVLLGVLVFNLAGSVQTAEAASICNAASFIADVTIPDGTYINPGAPFLKTWRLKNVGTCAWTPSYALMYYDGYNFGNTTPVYFPRWVSPGQTVDVSITLNAPTAGGTYRGYWKLQNATGIPFGIGGAATSAFWVEIRVLGQTTSATAYDFIQNMCSGLWVYDGGPIACPVNFNKLYLGYVQKIDNPVLENGQPAGSPALLTVPQNKYNGFIQGIFRIDGGIQKGDHFQATVGCQYGATGCSVRYQVDYGQNTGTDFVTLWKFIENYDGLPYNVDVDLSSVSYVKDPRIVLSVYANGVADSDLALWVNPRIVRNVQAPPTATPVGPTPVGPTPTPTALACSDKAQFITDVTVPDGTTFAPNQSFNKVWRLKNLGTCTWNTGYTLTFVSGNNMSAGNTPLTQSVAPGATVDAGINMVSPGTAGSYRGYWELKNSSGRLFGIGSAFDHPWWVDIKVVGTPVTTAPPSVTPVTVTPPSATPVTVTPPSSTPVTTTPPSATPETSTPPSATPTNTATTIPPSDTPTNTATNTPTATATTPSIAGWSTYQNVKYGFSFQFPPGSIVSSVSDNAGKIYLPLVTSGTNLGEKWLDVSVVEGANPCQSPETNQTMPTSTPVNVTINGLQWLKQTGEGAGMSQRWDWTGYSTLKGNACISMTFTLHSVVQGVVDPTPPAYDPDAESAVFSSIMSTFGIQ
jgi:hypothetical protein